MIHSTAIRTPLAAVVITCVAVLALWSPVPAAASTQGDINYINRLYSDLLLREPSASERDNAVWALGSGTSRSAVVQAIVGGGEFKVLWIDGVYMTYLDRLADDDEIVAGVGAFGSGGNFVGTEVTVLSSGEFLEANGGTNAGFVSALYQRVLFRQADSSGLAYWVGQLDSGARSRASVAATLIRGSESARRRVAGAGVGAPCATTSVDDDGALASGSYCLILKRAADQSGFTYWSTALTGSSQLPSLWTQLAASTEYYTHAQ